MTRRLVACSDGTWYTADRNTPGNVVEMVRSVLPQAPDGTDQILFYDPGVGTGGVFDKYSGGMFGSGLSKNVLDVYRFLVHNYVEGDEIYLFGFSRGAYTVRSAAGLIRNCGLLHKEHAGRANEAFRIYRERDEGPDTADAIHFREKYSRQPLRIKFIGVWDTVGALGIPVDFLRFLTCRHEFHDVSLSRSVDYAYQAMAIDEERIHFKPTLWNQHPEATDQVLEQAWFAGSHEDVGGGIEERGLSDGAFLWMAEKAEAAGLAFDGEFLQALSPDPLAPLRESRIFPFSLFAPFSRPIGVGVRSHESLHPSAQERYEKMPSYRPDNLVRHLRRQEPA